MTAGTGWVPTSKSPCSDDSPPLLLAALAATTTACTDAAATADPVPPVTSPPPTSPPPTGPPVTAPPTSEPGPADPELPTRYVEIDDGAFDDLDELSDASEVVVVATVTDEETIESDRDDVDPGAEAYLGLRLTVDGALKGDPGDEIDLAWLAFELGDEGSPIATNLLNGIPVPRTGARLVLFLRVVDEGESPFAYATHVPVRLDGVGFLEDDVVTIPDDVVPEVAVLTATSLEEIRVSV